MLNISSPKPKKNSCKLANAKALPVGRFDGFFDGFSVIIIDVNSMKELVTNGVFGKGNLSRSYPSFNKDNEVLRERQFVKRKELSEKFDLKHTKKVLIVPDSDEESDDYFTNLHPRFEIDKCGCRETVNLMLEEAFFLKNALECLNISYENKILDDTACWSLFSESDPLFTLKYTVYYYFRCKNWVVKPGLKFGGDFLLYKDGPAFNHASYVISIQNNNLDAIKLMGLHRICETAGKELLLVQVFPGEVPIHFRTLSNVKIKETLMKRWISTHEREEEQV